MNYSPLGICTFRSLINKCALTNTYIASAGVVNITPLVAHCAFAFCKLHNRSAATAAVIKNNLIFMVLF